MKTPLSLIIPVLLASGGLAQAADETGERAAQALREREVRREADRTEGMHLLAEGRFLSGHGRLEEAESCLRKAVALMPSSREAREELEGVRSALGSTPDRRQVILEELALARVAREDQQRAEVDGRIREAGRRMSEGRFPEAVRVLKEADEQIRWMAQGPVASEQERDRVRGMLEEANRAAGQEQERRRAAQVEEAARQAGLEMEAVRSQEARRVAALRDGGVEALRGGRWDEAERIAREIETLHPGDPDSARLALLSREQRHLSIRTELRGSAVEEWRNLAEFSNEQQVPYSREIMRHPDTWHRDQKRWQAAVASEEDQELPWKQQLRERLRQPVHYKFDGVPFRDAKEYLESQGKVVINVDKAAQDASPGLDETLISLASPEGGMSLESALNYLTRQVNLKWTLRDESITITTLEGSRDPDVLVQYDIRDLVYKVKDYPGPQVKIGQGGGGVEIDKEEDPEEGQMSREELVELIRKLVESSGGEAKR